MDWDPLCSLRSLWLMRFPGRSLFPVSEQKSTIAVHQSSIESLGAWWKDSQRDAANTACGETPQPLFRLSHRIFQQAVRKIPCPVHDAFDTKGIAFHVRSRFLSRSGLRWFPILKKYLGVLEFIGGECGDKHRAIEKSAHRGSERSAKASWSARTAAAASIGIPCRAITRTPLSITPSAMTGGSGQSSIPASLCELWLQGACGVTAASGGGGIDD